MSQVLTYTQFQVDSEVGTLTDNRGGSVYGRAQPYFGAPSTFTALQEVVFVAKNGNDATADGSIAKPFLTITQALASITDNTSAKPYTIAIAPGTYQETFSLKPFTFLWGWGRNDVRINNLAANWLSAGFSAAGTQDCGCFDVTMLNTVVADFSAVASPGAGRFFLYHINFDGVGTTITGNNSGNVFIGQACENIASGGAHVWNNINTILDAWHARAANITYSNTAAYSINATRWGLVTCAGGTLTISCASAANFLNVLSGAAMGPNNLVLTGEGAFLRSNSTQYAVTGPDADTTFRFDSQIVGATPLVTGGINTIVVTPTANRTYTIVNPAFSNPTQLRVFNAAPAGSGFIITMAGTGIPTNQTYIPPQASWIGSFQSALPWRVQPVMQGGSVALVSGVSPFIPADMSADSTITVTLRTLNNADVALGAVLCPSTDRVNGTRAGGGGFKIRDVDPTSGNPLETDISTYDWHVYTP
jgi:hypothetical protein